MLSKCMFSNEDTLFVGRFVYDVLSYTLTICGFQENQLPEIDCGENVYQRAKFVKIAGASVLRVALIMREDWKDTFLARRKSLGSNSENVSLCLAVSAVSCPLSRNRIAQSAVEVMLALCNEMFLFLHHEGIEVDHIEVMKSISTYILLISGSDQNISEKIEGFFDYFDNIKKYTKWITNFIQKYAIPYRSRDDVPYLFCERIRNRFIDLKKASPPDTSSMEIVKTHIGYIPRHIYSFITDEECELLPEHLVVASGSAISDNSKSLDPTKSPGPSGTGDQAESNLRGRKSTGSKDIPKETAKNEESMKNLPVAGIDDDLGRMNLGSEGVSQTSHSAKARPKPKQKPDDMPEHTTKGEQSIKNPPVVGIEEDFGQMSLVDEENSQASHGAVPKRKLAKAVKKSVRKVSNVSLSQ